MRQGQQQTAPIDVLMLLRGAVEDYPPTIHQANILAESGCRVALLDNKYERFAAYQPVLDSSIRRISVPGWDSLRNRPQSIQKRLLNFWRYSRAVARALESVNPRVVIAFDSSAFYFLGKRQHWPDQRKCIVHFHELPEVRGDLSRGGLRDVRYAIKNARHTHATVFPEPNRAAAFSRAAGLSAPPFIVLNCPRRLEKLPENRLAAALAGRNLPGARAVIYQGLIGKYRGLHSVIRSIPTWPEDVCFLLLGPGDAAVIADFKQLSVELGLTNRVIVLPPVSSLEVMSYTVGAQAGIALYEQVGNNERFAASNKLMEYIAVGVPQVTSIREGVGAQLHGRWGYAVNPTSPQEIGAAINRIFSAAAAAAEMSRAAREAHLRIYNYESQFAPVATLARAWVESGTN